MLCRVPDPGEVLSVSICPLIPWFYSPQFGSLAVNRVLGTDDPPYDVSGYHKVGSLVTSQHPRGPPLFMYGGMSSSHISMTSRMSAGQSRILKEERESPRSH